jgi:hypothetical protein
MWERGARHNPASFRYRFYMDHRPILPQDPTLEFVRKSYNQYENIYFCFRTSQNKVKYIFSNNLPVKDREELKALVNMDNLVGKSIKYFALLFSLFLSGYVFNKMNFAKKYHKRIGVVLASYFANYGVLQNMYSYKFQEFTSHYYFKFQHLAVDDINEIKDKRRSYFTVDKSVYYRESSSDIRHAAHHPANEGHHDHDTSTYYGPYPVIIFF